MEAADQALYNSNRRGRNRVTHYDDLRFPGSRITPKCVTSRRLGHSPHP